MPPDRGIKSNWGSFFDFGDCLEVPGGFEHKAHPDPAMPQLEWTITFWTMLSPQRVVGYRDGEDRVLV